MIQTLFRWSLTLIFLVIIGGAGIIGWRFLQFSQYEQVFNEPQTITINVGESMTKIAESLQNKLSGETWQWILLAKIKRADRKLKAGDYVLSGRLTPAKILDKMVLGDVRLHSVRIAEGKTFAVIRAALEKNQQLKNDIKGVSMADLAPQINANYHNLEGLVYPDTYRVINGAKVSDVLRLGVKAMQKKLSKMWEKRNTSLPLNSPYEALILASIVEKETGAPDDRGIIASVFMNRLNARMPMQSDPTVIYGLGSKFNGNLTRVHLKTPNAYNTYTIKRLPPTPISSISEASLQAVLLPPKTPYYYFVARGDGSSQFSRNLREHNRSVNIYQRRRKK